MSQRWDLSELEAERAETLFGAIRAFARAYARRAHRLDLADVRQLLARRDVLLARLGRFGALAGLRFAEDAADASALEFVRLNTRLAMRAGRVLAGFEARLAAIARDNPEIATVMLDTAGLSPHRHFLAKTFAAAAYRLDPAAEADLAGRETRTLREASERWGRLCAGAAVQRFLPDLVSAGRERRLAASLNLGEAAARRSRGFCAALGLLIAAESVSEKARGLPDRLVLADVVEDSPVRARNAAMAAMRRAFPLVARYYRLKARVLGLSGFYDHDRAAPLPGLPTFGFDDAAGLVLEAFSTLSPAFAQTAKAILDTGRIDALPRKDKQTGAFCLSPPAAMLPFVLLNFNGTWRDVSVLAHEWGHGAHAALSAHLPVSAREVAPVLSEAVAFLAESAAFELAFARAGSDRARLALACSRIEDAIVSAPRQAALFAFEQAVRDGFARSGRIVPGEVRAAWLGVNRDFYGKAVELTGSFAWHWALTPHFFLAPGYVRHYPVAWCLSLGLAERRARDPGRFGRTLEAVCACGSSEPLGELAGLFGLDIADARLYHNGVDKLRSMIETAEDLYDGLRD